jgi:hypothetical protein
VNGSGSGLCLTACFGISGVDRLRSVSTPRVRVAAEEKIRFILDSYYHI